MDELREFFCREIFFGFGKMKPIYIMSFDNIKALLGENKLPGYFRMIWDGESMEYCDLPENGCKDAANDRFFVLGLISTLYYNFLCVKLFQKGILNIYRSLHSYDERLPDWINIYDLMNCTSGCESIALNPDIERDKINPLKYYIEFIIRNRITFFNKLKYGKREYNTTNGLLIQYALEKVTGSDIKTLMKKEVFEDLKLKDIDFIISGKLNVKGSSEIPASMLDGYYHDLIATPNSVIDFVKKIGDDTHD